MKKVFSGIQPSGNLHIGNYIGAIKQWVEMQNTAECLFCIVDLHAITVPQDPKVLKEKILEVAALYLACGIDPKKAKIFVQSENPNHTELAWILNTITPFGQLERMTQFKDKSEKHGENVGLFDYPVLMAADILLYDTDEVPVGEDQKQHIELTRDLAERFNHKFGEVFILPNPVIQKETARIMSLQNPTSKMSKSDANLSGTLNILDSEDQIRVKIMKAVTDSGDEIIKSPEKPAMSNLLTIFSAVTKSSVEDLEKQYKGVGYGEFKSDLATAVNDFLTPVRKKYDDIRGDEKLLNSILDEGRDFVVEKSSQTLIKAKNAVGLGR